MKTRLILLSAALLAVAWTTTQAQSIWTGTNGTLWNDAGNWDVLPAANSTLTFNGSTNTTTSNDFAANTEFDAITFNGSAAAFSLGGNAITLGGNITFDANPAAPVTHVIDLGLVLNGDRAIFTQANGTIDINGVISETGGSRKLTKDTQTSTLRLLNTANTFSGLPDIQRGTVVVTKLDNAGNASSLGTGTGNASIKIGQQNVTGVLIYNGTSASSTNRMVVIGQGTTANQTGGATIRNDAADANHTLSFTNATFNTQYTQNAIITKVVTLGGNNTGNNTVAGVIRNNTGGTISLTKADAGTWIVSGNNTYGGNTTVSAGTLVAAHDNALGDTAAGTTVSSNATLALQGGISVGSESLTIAGTGADAGGALRNISGNNTYGGVVTTTAATRIASDAGALSLGAIQTNATTAGGRDVTFAGAGNISVSGIIGTGGNATVRNLTKDGAGTLTLSGSNDYTGTTFFNAGQLNLNHNNALGSGNSTFTWTNGTTLDNTSGGAVVLPNNAPVTLGNLTGDVFTFGGSNNLDLGTGRVSLQNQIDKTIVLNGNRTLALGTVFSNRNGNNNLTVSQGTGSGAQLVLRGLEINSQANVTASKTLSIVTDATVAITGPVVGGNNETFTYSLAKRGNGTLILQGNNTYNGTTTVNGGVLLVEGKINSIGTVTLNNNSTLRLGADNASSTEGQLFVNNGTVDLDGFNQTISTTPGYVSLGGVAGAAPRIDSGAGTLALATANSGTGITYDASNNPLGATISGNLQYSASASNIQFVLGDSTATDEELTISAAISGGAGAGTFYTTGEGTLVLSGNSTFDPLNLQFRGGRIVLAADANAGSGTLGAGSETVDVGFATLNYTVSLLLKEGVTNARNVRLVRNTSDPATYTRAIGGVNTAGNATFSGTVLANDDLQIYAAGGGTVLFTNVISGTNASFTVNKIGNGTAVFSANNTYAANTTVSEGVLSLAAGDAIPDANTLVIDGGVVDLAVSETVGVLILGNATQGNNTYGSTSSAAVVKNDTYFSGTGILTVGDGGGAPVVSFATWAAFYGLNGSLTDNFDGDKFTDGEEYAYDLDPTVDELGNVLASQTTLAGGNVTLTLAFSGNTAKSDIDYVVRRANNPGFTSNTVVGHWNGTANWTTSNSTYFGNQTQSGAGDVKDINVNMAIPAATEPRQFLKVDIE